MGALKRVSMTTRAQPPGLGATVGIHPVFKKLEEPWQRSRSLVICLMFLKEPSACWMEEWILGNQVEAGRSTRMLQRPGERVAGSRSAEQRWQDGRVLNKLKGEQ